MNTENDSNLDLTISILNNFGGVLVNTFLASDICQLGEIDFEPNLNSTSYYHTIDSFLSSRNDLTNSFTIFGLNAQCLNAKIEEIKVFLHTLSESDFFFDVLCFQETWLGVNSDISQILIEGYHLISAGKSCSAHGGLATYIRNNYIYEHLFSVTNSPVWEGLFIKITLKHHKHLILGNIYRPPRDSREEITIFQNSFSETLARISDMRCETILAGDFNFNLLKHSQSSPTRDFLDLIISDGFSPMITIPTRFNARSASLLDNVLMKSANNSVHDNGVFINKLSDHQGYFLQLKNMIAAKKNPRYITVTKRSANFLNDIRDEIQATDFQSILSVTNDVNQNCDALLEKISNAIKKFSSTKTCRPHKHKHKMNPWITFGIIRSIRFRDKLFKRLKQTELGSLQYEELKTNLATYNNILKKTIREAKKQYYSNAFYNSRDDPKKTWKIISQVLRKGNTADDLPEYLEVNDRRVSGENDIINALNKHFATIGKSLAESVADATQNFENFLVNQRDFRFEFNPIDQQQVEKIIDKLQNKNSCASDGISTRLLKHLKSSISGPLAFLINQSIQNCTFPNALKVARVISLFKKGNRHDPNNYRPISILPSISKVFEKVIQMQIVDFFDTNCLFSSGQYGFRSNHSTELAALELADHLYTSMDKGDIALSIFIDLSKAFDCLNHQILLKKLCYYGFSNQALNLMTSYLSNRKQFVEVSGISSNQVGINTGVPQGSILGPLLFLIYLNDFPLSSNHFQMINYADDTALTCSLSASSDPTNSSRIEIELSKVSQWLKANKLTINVSKSKAMFFHTKQRSITLPDIILNQEKIEIVDTFNYLGIVFDRHLTWLGHVDSVASKISKTVGILKQLRHFLPPNILKLIYDSLITCRVKYGLLVWGECSQRIYKLQKKAVRIISNSKFNAHTDPLFRNLNILKINDDKKMQELIFYYKYQHGKLPQFFSRGYIQEMENSHITRNAKKLVFPSFKHEFFRKNLRYTIVNCVNRCPSLILEKVSTHSLKGYIQYMKKYLTIVLPV